MNEVKLIFHHKHGVVQTPRKRRHITEYLSGIVRPGLLAARRPMARSLLKLALQLLP